MILSVDSQLLNAVQSCSTKAKFSFIENLQPQTKAVALEKGDLIHKCLEVYDGLRGKVVNEASETWQSLKEVQLYGTVEGLYGISFEDQVRFVNEVGKFYASKMQLDT